MQFSTAFIAIISIGLVAATPVQPHDPRATVGWNDPNTYKNNPTLKQDYENKACAALDRAGCNGGTIMGGEHTSKSDSNNHVTVKPDGKKADGSDGGMKKTMHVYPDGTASKKGKGGKTTQVRDTEWVDAE